MDSAASTKSNAKSTPKSSTTRKAPLDILRNASNAIVPRLRSANPGQAGEAIDVGESDVIGEVTLLAVGGYNSVFLVKLLRTLLLEDVPTHTGGERDAESCLDAPVQIDRFVLRLPCEDALVPHQVANEVAFKRFVALRLPRIPVPRVLFFEATDDYETSFIAEEFINGAIMSSEWMSLRPEQKESLALQLASATVDFAEVQFDMIGGLSPLDFTPAPTVEGAKLFKGRQKFHRDDCYPIGPYGSTKEYILACYDREIYYYTHAADDDIDLDLFEGTSVQAFVSQLKERKKALAARDIGDEPFVLVHGDFHARNILISGDRVVAVLDWEFSGSYPLSETLSGGGVDVVEPETEQLDEENTVWDRKIRDFIRQETVSRGWTQARIDLLMGNGNRELGVARTEMFP